MFNKQVIFLIYILALVKAAAGNAEADNVFRDPSDPVQSPLSWTWVDNCHVLRSHDLTDFGTHYSLLATYTQQSILSGAQAKGKTRGNFSYIATIEQDLWQGGSLIAYGEGGKGKGIDPLLDGFLTTNGTIEQASVYLSRLFLLNNFSDGHMQIVAGKIDLSDFFDTSAVANCEIKEFLADPLVNNPTIPFPNYGIGAAIKVNPSEKFYFQAGLADAKAKGTTTGFKSTFGDELKLFQIMELGLRPHFGGRNGTYRFIYWHNAVSQDTAGNFTSHGIDGWALSFDQQINDGVEVFGRYGFANHPVSDIKHFWSTGGRVKGLWQKRNKDFVEIAVAQGISPNRLGQNDETLIEMDYSAHINKSLSITPLLQIISGLPGDNGPAESVIGGIRLVWAF
jgi:hypothetical protein